MQELKEVIDIVFDKRLGKIETLNKVHSNNNLLYLRLLRGIRSGKFRSDDEAANELYNTDGKNRGFQRMKDRFRNKLYTTALFVEPRQKTRNSNISNLFYCYKNLVVSKLLLTIGARSAGIRLISLVLSKALIFEFYEIVIECSLRLRRDSMLSGNVKKYEQYKKIFNDSIELLQSEALAEDIYNSVSIHLNLSKSVSQELITKAKWAYEEIDKILVKCSSFIIKQNEYYIKSTYFELAGDYEKAIEICLGYEKYLLDSPIFYSKSRQANVLTEQTACYLHMKKIEKATEAANKAIELQTVGSENWYTALELKFLIHMNIRNITELCKIYLEASSHPRFQHIRENKMESWKIFAGYLWFVLKLNNREDLINEVFSGEQDFKLGRMMNDVPHYSKDKKGYNVALIILQILVMLLREDFTKITALIESLQSYAYRNLKVDDAQRSHYFIKLIIMLEKNSFNPRIAQKKSIKLMERLKAQSVNFNATQTRMEIIPYEELWDMIIEILQLQMNKNKLKVA